MALTSQMEKAWLADEGMRFSEQATREIRNAKWRNRILQIEEWNLPDYERPVKKINFPRKKIWPQIKKALRYLLP